MNKKLVIVLLVILLLLSFGYIVYDKVVIQRDTDKEIKELKDQINNLTNTNENDSNSQGQSCSKYMEAEFYGEYIGNGKNMKEILKLHKDGKFDDIYENSEKNEGTYFIENGKITLTYPKSVVSNGDTVIYDITNNCSTINKNGDIKVLNRK